MGELTKLDTKLVPGCEGEGEGDDEGEGAGAGDDECAGAGEGETRGESESENERGVRVSEVTEDRIMACLVHGGEQRQSRAQRAARHPLLVDERSICTRRYSHITRRCTQSAKQSRAMDTCAQA